MFDETTGSPIIAHRYEAPFAGNIRLRVTDDQNPPMAAECETHVRVADTKAPQIVNVTLLPDVEWIENQQMVALQLHVDAQDLCDPNPACRIADVTTDPPNHAHGHHATRLDWEITDALSLQLLHNQVFYRFEPGESHAIDSSS